MRDDLLRAVLDQPGDDEPRLVLADWLIERGDPRGEYISLACRLARMAHDDPAHAELEDRVNAIMLANRMAFSGDLPRRCKSFTFDRGFVERVTMTAAAFARWGEELCAREPIAQLAVEELDDLEALAACPALARIRRLRLGGRGELAALGDSPHLTAVRVLRLDHAGDAPEDWQRLIARLRAPRLEQLQLYDSRGSGLVYRELARSTALPVLDTFVEIQREHLDGGSGFARALSGLEALGTRDALRSLALQACACVTDLTIRTMFAAGATRLRSLTLSDCPVTDATLATLTGRALEELRIVRTGVTAAGVRAFVAGSPALRRVFVPPPLEAVVRELRPELLSRA